MADQVQLGVMLTGAEQAIANLAQIDAYVKGLNGKNIKIAVSSTGITRAANQAEKLNTNLTNASTSAQKIGTAAPQAMQKTAKATETAAGSAQKFSLGLGSIAANLLKFQAVNLVINGTAKAFKFAFQEMKNVDTEMVNIRKVTGFSADEMERLEKSAYSLASKYGRTASEVLAGGTTFARAGYTDQIEQLSELSLLLQNVGDLQADDASKFIVATDKAYKLGGSYEDLMATIDGLDNITNKNATDMQKMTDGMTIAGSVFAESGESIETFAALLGTATANTQRSGSEVARGLRTILMNLRQIRVAMDENGEPIYAENVAAASKALQEFAGISTMENGQLRKASDVLGELAGVWGTLGENEKAAIAEAVAGKRQANILMSLMGNWESIEKMRQEYENSAGTAAKENAAYMDSWQAKIEQVKASWTELVSSIVSTDAIKGGADTVVNLLNTVNNLFQSPLVQKALTLFSGLLNDALKIVDGFVDGIDTAINALTSTSKDRLEQTEKYLSTARENLYEAGQASREAKQNVLEMQKEYDQDFGEGSRYDYLVSNIEKLNDAEKLELGILEGQRREREKLVQLAEEAAKLRAEEVQEEQKKILSLRDSAAYEQNLGISSSLFTANEYFRQNQDVGEYSAALASIIGQYQEYYNALIQTKEAGEDLSDQEQRFTEGYENLVRTYSEGGSVLDVYGKASAIEEYTKSLDDWGEAADTANGKIYDLAQTMDEIPEFTVINIAVNGYDEAASKLSSLVQMATSPFAGLAGEVTSGIPHFAGGTGSAPGGPSLVNERGPEMISANGLAFIAGGGRPSIVNLPRGATVLTAEDTKRLTSGNFGGAIPAYAIGTEDEERGYRYLTESDFDTEGFSIYGSERDAAFWASHPGLREKYEAARRAGRDATNQYKSQAGGGGGSQVKSFKALEKELSDRLKNLDLQAKLAENEEDFLKAMEIYGDAQDYIAELLDKYRAAGYAEDSDEVLRLANLGYDYAAKQLGGYDDLQSKLIEALNALTDATEDANALQERQEAVDKAREALANAEKQRTVRIFNPVTGQWEWVANAADVQKAQENLRNAEDSLQKEELAQAINAIKNANPEDLANMTIGPAILDKLFGGTPEQQSAFLNALNGAYGGASYLGSTAAQTAFNQGNTIGTQYNLNGINITPEQAATMTIKDLLNMLQGLKIM